MMNCKTVGVLAVSYALSFAGIVIAGDELILDQGIPWRFLMAGNSTPAIQTTNGVEKADPGWARGLVPAGWTAIEFDDQAWGMSPGPFFGPARMYGFNSRWTESSSGYLGLLCARGRFEVLKPAEMNLQMTYRGGVVIYVNGREVARQHLPKGELEAGTLADPYPKEAFVDDKGKILEGHETQLLNPAIKANHFEKRLRRLSLTIPADAFRVGVNVLAVEVHRAPYDAACLIGPKRIFYGDKWGDHGWGTAGLTALELKAASGVAVSAVARPKGFQVWNASPMRGVYTMDAAPVGSRLGAIELAGTRNGAFSGQVVVSCDAPINGLKGVMSDLKQASGPGVIPASAVEVRYGGFSNERGGIEDGSPNRYRGMQVQRFDALLEAPPATVQVFKPWRREEPNAVEKSCFGAVQPVWITVNVPADATPGDYAGILTVSATGLPDTAVPVKISVQAFKLPDPKNYVTFVDFVPSPETLALWYKKEHYSDDHFKLMEKTFKQTGRVGQKVIWLEMVARSNNGNSQTMVRWIKQPDGSYKYDFSVFDRYLDLAQKYVEPKFVVLYLWDCSSGIVDWGGKLVSKGNSLVSELDPATGKVKETPLSGPGFGDEEAAEKFWRPVLEEVRDRLKKRGLLDKALWGEGFENFTGPCAARVLKKIVPEVKGWSLSGHMAWTKVGDSPVLLNEHCYSFMGGSKYGWDPSTRAQNWNEVNYHREAWFTNPLRMNRTLAEESMKSKFLFGNFVGLKGVGRLGADFWDLGLKGHESRGFVANRYPESIRIAREITTGWLAPGPNGAVSSVRFEMFREGLQELEARIFIEQKVIADAAGKAMVGEELAGRCEQALRERGRVDPLSSWGTASTAVSYPVSGWQERSGRIFALAAGVAEKSGKQ